MSKFLPNISPSDMSYILLIKSIYLLEKNDFNVEHVDLNYLLFSLQNKKNKKREKSENMHNTSLGSWSIEFDLTYNLNRKFKF